MPVAAGAGAWVVKRKRAAADVAAEERFDVEAGVFRVEQQVAAVVETDEIGRAACRERG